MSFQAMTWAVDVELPTNQKMVLLMLANRTNHDTGQCNPSHKRLAQDCGMSISTLKRCIKQLVDAGLVEVLTKKMGDVNLPNQYKLKMQGVGSQRTYPSSHRTEGVGSQWPTNHEVNNQEENLSNRRSAQAPSSDSVKAGDDHKAVFEHWQSVHGKTNAKLIKDRLSKINARLKEGYTVDQLKRAIDGCKLSPFHMGDNDNRTLYNDLKTILRDGAQVEKFISMAENPPKPPKAKAGYMQQDYKNTDWHEGVSEDGKF